MASITHLVLSLFILVLPYGTSGYTINRDSSKVSPTTPPEQQPSQDVNSKGTSVTTAESSSPIHHVPLDVAPRAAVSLVKREITPDDEKVNGLSYDRDMMVWSKRSAAALNKLVMALRSSMNEAPNSSENELDSTDKDAGKYSRSGFRPIGSGGLNYESFPPNALQRRGQKDRKIYLRCYFNAVSCFRK